MILRVLRNYSYGSLYGRIWSCKNIYGRLIIKTHQISTFLGSKRFYSEAKTLKSSKFVISDNAFQMTKLVNGTTHMKLGITENACNKLTEISNKDQNPDSAIKIQVQSGGCHGYQYDIKLTTLPQELDKDNDLLVFSRIGSNENAKIIIDQESLKILQGSKLDYTKELIGSQFKVVDSPYTSSSCGCGGSFDFDFDKFMKDQEALKSLEPEL